MRLCELGDVLGDDFFGLFFYLGLKFCIPYTEGVRKVTQLLP